MDRFTVLTAMVSYVYTYTEILSNCALQICTFLMGIMAQAWNLSTWAAEAGESGVRGKPELPRKILSQ